VTEYRDSSQGSPILEELNRLLGASFRAGRFFGVEIRVLWITVIIFPAGILMSFTGVPPLMLLAALLGYPLMLALVIYSHEMGHVVAGWRYRINTPLITISPLGGLAHMASGMARPRDDIVVTLAGPAVHVLWLAVAWPLSLAFDPMAATSHWSALLRGFLAFVVATNVTLLVFNLLPIFPMDGGRVLRAMLSLRLHPNRATIIAARIGMVGAVGIGVVGVPRGGVWSAISIALAFRIFTDCRRAVREAKYGDGPWGRTREPWEGDSDAWKPGADPADRQSPPRGRKRRERATQDEAAHAAELDRVLERISAVGMNGLTRAERKILANASQRLDERSGRSP
jgi:Zn-dependent protease